MSKVGKKYREAAEKIEQREYAITDAIGLAKEASYAGFDETLEITMNLGVDPRHADQMVRGTTVLPHGLGKTVRVLAVAQGEKVKEAEEAGADFVGGEDMVKKIQEGWLDFDAMVATPDMMKEVGKLGKILGPRGLMPNPKLGTVTFEVGKAVQDAKAGKVEFRVDKTGIIHCPVGKKSFEDDKLQENVNTLFEAVMKAKPPGAKGKYLKSAYLCTSMSPSIQLDISDF